MTAPAVRFTGVSRRFPGVAALTGVSFDVAKGSCHAICGENGAGKSTLGRILAGIERADAGTVELDGEAVHFRDPRAALAGGVAIVHQEPSLCGNLSVAENLLLGRLPQKGGFVDRAALRREASALLALAGAHFDPDREVASLSVAEQQLVQIGVALGANARVIIFDEPTSSLGDRETKHLHGIIGSLRSRGTTVIYVSHRLQEVRDLCDSVTVLRDGAHVATRAIAGLDESSLVEMMIGRRLEQFFPAHAARARGAPALELDRLRPDRGWEDVSFTVHAGEVVALAGLVGAGRSDIAEAIFGLRPAARGSVRVRGEPVRLGSARWAMARRVGFVPEDRKRLGFVSALVNRENGSLPSLPRHARRGWVDRRSEDASVRAAFERVGLGADPEIGTATLSGGNQQKVVIAKWLAAESDVLVLDEPTRGVDVGAKAELHAWIDRYAAAGGAVLLISSDMPELLSLATRVLVLRERRIVGELSRAEASQDRVLRLMSGLEAAGSSR